MRVCLFGTYEEDYPRNRTMINGLEGCGFEIVRCHYSLWKGRTHKFGDVSRGAGKLRRAWHYLRVYLRVSFEYIKSPRCDLIYVGYPGQLDVIVARVLTIIKPAPVVFDAFLSLYDSFVSDRKIVERGSLPAKALFLLDRYACKWASVVILDTRAHIRYFVDEFSVAPSKFRRIFIGADDALFSPRKIEESHDRFLVGFIGKFIPLHGLEFIVRAAKLLETNDDIQFIIAGEGQMKESMRSLAEELGVKNISFRGWIPYEEVPVFLCPMDVCLGIFGDTDKAARVIPNKVFEAMAMEKPVVTRRSPAADELLVDGRDALLCEAADPRSIADAVLRLKNDRELSQAVARGGRETFLANCGSKNVSEQLRAIISGVLGGQEKE
jgi:glycosyltransferase involved in cell wall biosynthesis